MCIENNKKKLISNNNSNNDGNTIVLKQTFGKRRKAAVQNLYRCHLCTFSCVDRDILLKHFADVHPC